MTTTYAPKVGDVVWIGDSGDPLYKATWEVRRLDSDGDRTVYATLTSGRTGRTAVVPAHKLTPYRLTEGAA